MIDDPTLDSAVDDAVGKISLASQDTQVVPPYRIRKQPQDFSVDKIPAGLVIERQDSSVLFNYMSLDKVPNRILQFQGNGTNVLKIYMCVSYESFRQAEQLYKKTRDLKDVDGFLTIF